MPDNLLKFCQEWGFFCLFLTLFMSLTSILWWRVQKVKKEKRARAIRMKLRRNKRSALPPQFAPYNATQSLHPEAPERRPIILIVDDSRTALAGLNKILETGPYRVISAKNGQEAWTVMQEVKPDLIISDIDMPVMTGFQLLKLIREDYNLTEMPVILATSHLQKHIEANKMKQDYDAFLHKPFNQKELLEQVHFFLQE